MIYKTEKSVFASDLYVSEVFFDFSHNLVMIQRKI